MSGPLTQLKQGTTPWGSVPPARTAVARKPRLTVSGIAAGAVRGTPTKLALPAASRGLRLRRTTATVIVQIVRIFIVTSGLGLRFEADHSCSASPKR